MNIYKSSTTGFCPDELMFGICMPQTTVCLRLQGMQQVQNFASHVQAKGMSKEFYFIRQSTITTERRQKLVDSVSTAIPELRLDIVEVLTRSDVNYTTVRHRGLVYNVTFLSMSIVCLAH